MLYLLSVATAIDELSVFVCPDGYEQTGTRCRRYTKKNLVPDCIGGELIGKDQCAKYVHGVASCRDGKMDEGLCMRYDVQKPLVFCEDSYTLVSGGEPHGHKKEHGAFCYKTNEAMADTICPWGTIDEGERCVTYTKFNPKYECPLGSISRGNGCKISQEYPCDDFIVNAKKAGKKNDKGHHNHLRMLGEKLKTNSIGKESQRLIGIQRMCERTIDIEAIVSCPDGSKFDKYETQCVAITSYPREKALAEVGYLETEPIVVCPNMYERCYDNAKKHKGFKIPKGSHDLHCCGFTSETPMVECPVGYEFDIQKEKCMAIYQPEYICPNPAGKEGCNTFEYVNALEVTVPGHANIPTHQKKKSHH